MEIPLEPFSPTSGYVLQRPRAGPAHLLGGGEHGKFDAKRITWEKSQSRVGMSFTVVAYRALGY